MVQLDDAYCFFVWKSAKLVLVEMAVRVNDRLLSISILWPQLLNQLIKAQIIHLNTTISAHHKLLFSRCLRLLRLLRLVPLKVLPLVVRLRLLGHHHLINLIRVL